MKVSFWFAVLLHLIGLIAGFLTVIAIVVADPEWMRGTCDRLIAKHSVNYADYAKAKTEE